MTTTAAQRIAELRAIVAAQHERLVDKDRVIERLETLLAKLRQQRFGASSERHLGQGELHLFDEAEGVMPLEN